MDAKITIALMNFKRPENVEVIVNSLRSQTVPCQIFLWDNAQEHTQLAGIDWVVRSSQNAFCWPRFFMMAYAQTEFAMTLDDDLNLASDQSLEIILNELRNLKTPNEILGPEGVLLRPGSNYYPDYPRPLNRRSIPVDYPDSSVHLSPGKVDFSVDIVKGRSMAMRTGALMDVAPISFGPENVFADDIGISAMMGKGQPKSHRVPASFRGVFRNLPQRNAPMALSSQRGWRKTRNQLCQRFFPDR